MRAEARWASTLFLVPVRENNALSMIQTIQNVESLGMRDFSAMIIDVKWKPGVGELRETRAVWLQSFSGSDGTIRV